MLLISIISIMSITSKASDLVCYKEVGGKYEKISLVKIYTITGPKGTNAAGVTITRYEYDSIYSTRFNVETGDDGRLNLEINRMYVDSARTVASANIEKTQANVKYSLQAEVLHAERDGGNGAIYGRGTSFVYYCVIMQ